MQFTNTLNNHPKNKRKKNYYHADKPQVPLIVQTYINNNQNDWFLNEIKELNKAFNQYQYNEKTSNINVFEFRGEIQPMIDVLHHHLYDESNSDFFEKNKSNIQMDLNPNLLKQNKNVEIIKKEILEENKPTIKIQELIPYAIQLNKHHLLDTKLIEQLINHQINIPSQYLKKHLKFHAQIKKVTNIDVADYFKFLKSIARATKKDLDKKYFPTSEQIDAIDDLLSQKHDLYFITEIVKQTLNLAQNEENCQYRLHPFDSHSTFIKIMLNLLKQQYKTGEIIESIQLNKNEYLSKRSSIKIEIIKNILKNNPEFLLLNTTNNEIDLLNFNKILQTTSSSDLRFTTMLNILRMDDHLNQKTYNHLTKQQYKKLKQIIRQVKENNHYLTLPSYFNNLYHFAEKHPYYDEYDDLIFDKFKNFTFTNNELFTSVNDANNQLQKTLNDFYNNFENYSDDEIIESDELYNEYENYNQQFEYIQSSIKSIINQPYRFYQIFNRTMSEELKIITLKERLNIDQYLSMKQIKSIQKTIQRHKNNAQNTINIISIINTNSLLTNIVFKNTHSQKQIFKYLHQDSFYKSQMNVYEYSKSQQNKNFNQIIQQSTNPHQQFYLNAGSKLIGENDTNYKKNYLFQYNNILAQSLLKNRQQYAKQIIELCCQIQMYKEQNYGKIRDIYENREYIRNKHQHFQTIIKHTSNKIILDQLKQAYQLNCSNTQTNNLNTNDENLKYLPINELRKHAETLNEFLEKYPKTFKLVEPFVN